MEEGGSSQRSHANARRGGGATAVTIAGTALAAIAGWAWSKRARAELQHCEDPVAEPGSQNSEEEVGCPTSGKAHLEKMVGGKDGPPNENESAHSCDKQALQQEDEGEHPNRGELVRGAALSSRLISNGWDGRARGSDAADADNGDMGISRNDDVSIDAGRSSRPRWKEWAKHLGSKAAGIGDYVIEPFYRQWVVQQLHEGARPRSRGAAAALAAGRGQLQRQESGRRASEADLTVNVAEVEQDLECAQAAHEIYLEDESECAAALGKGGYTVVHIQPQDGASKLQHPKWAVLCDARRARVIVVYRGTWSWSDTIHDLVFIPAALPCGVKVNKGPSMGVAWSAPSILEKLHSAIACCRTAGRAGPTVLFTGHSYGGGCAILLRLHAVIDSGWIEALRGCRVAAVTFGAPLVFGASSLNFEKDPDESSQAAIVRTVGESTRNYVNQGDIIPRLLGPHASSILSMLSLVSPGFGSPSECGSGRRAAQYLGGVVGSIAGSYAPVGSFLFLYARSDEVFARRVEACGSPSEAAELDRMLLPAKAAFMPYCIRDHSTALYVALLSSVRDKTAPSIDETAAA